MIRKYGFTIIELIITVGMMTILLGSITVVFWACFRSFNANASRSQIRTQLSQTVDLMTKELYNAQAITSCTSSILSFNTNLFYFTVSGASNPPAQGDEYTNNGFTFTIVSTNISGGSGNIIASLTGAGGPASSGSLTVVSGHGSGTSPITFSAYQKNVITYSLDFYFKVTGASTPPGAGDEYTNNSNTYTIVSANISGGSGTIIASGNASPASSGSLTVVAGHGSGTSPITFSSYTSGLDRNFNGTLGLSLATGIQPPSTSVSWGTTPSLFICSNGLLAVDLTAVNNGQLPNAPQNKGEVVHMQSYIQMRNIPMGLLGWWDFNDLYPATSGSCSTAIDATGNGNAGTCTNSPTWTTGNTGGNGALSFTGLSTQSVKIPYTATLNIGVFSESIWFKTSSNNVCLTDWHGSNVSKFRFFIGAPGNMGDSGGSANELTAEIYSTGGSHYTNVTTSAAVNNGNWHNAAAVMNGSTLSLYLDGLLVAGPTSVQAGNLTESDAFIIGASESSGNAYNDYFTGTIDDVRVYNQAISANEVQQIYRGE